MNVLKTISLLVMLVLLIATPLLAQETYFEKTLNSHLITVENNLEYAGDGNWILGGAAAHYTVPYCTSAIMYKVNETGETIWEVDAGQLFEEDVLPAGTVDDFKILADGTIICLANRITYCDAISSDIDGLYLIHLSSEGMPIWLQRIETYWTAIPLIETFSNGTSLIVIKSGEEVELRWYSPLGDLEQTINIENQVNDLLIRNDANVLVATDNSLLIMNELGDLENELVFEQAVSKVEQWDNGFLLMVGTSLVWINENYEVITEQDYSFAYESLTDIAMDANGYAWLIGQSNSTGQSVLESIPPPLTLPPVFNATIIDDFSTAMDVRVAENVVAIAGKEDTQYTAHAFIKTYDKYAGQTLAQNTDVGVTNTWITNEIVIPGEGIGDFSSISYDMHVMVKNFGTSTIQEVYLNNRISTPWFDGDTYFYKHFAISDLLPNDSVELVIPNVGFYAYISLPNFNTCAWASGANNLLDTNHLNDNVCNQFPLITSIENKDFSFSFTLSPNPTSNLLHLQMDATTFLQAQTKTYNLYNIQGKLLRTANIATANQTINTVALPTGIYLLQINLDGKIKTQKVIKQ